MSPPLLTKRERKVLEGRAQGLAYKEIAARLGISRHTVRTHVVNLLRKLDARSSTHAVSKFYATDASGRAGEAVAVAGLAAPP
jgi:DNA-binding CsgD family transcriptional regulator